MGLRLISSNSKIYMDSEATFRFFKGVFYAKVTLRLVSDLPPGVDLSRPTLSGQEFDWLKSAYGPDAYEWTVCDSFRSGAIFGIQYAFLNSFPTPHIHLAQVMVVEIDAHAAHSTELSVAYASFYATLQLLNIASTKEPVISGRTILFP